jgi:hypothetical protein
MQQSESFIKADKSSDLIPWSAVTIDIAFFTLYSLRAKRYEKVRKLKNKDNKVGNLLFVYFKV